PAPSVVGDLIVCGKRPLHLPRRLETLHGPLSSSCRLVGVFRPVVEALVLAMLDAGHDLPLGRGIAAQLVGDQHPRRSPLLLQKLAQQAFGGLLAFLSRRLSQSPPGRPRAMTAPVASGWSVSPAGTCTHWKAPPFTARARSGSLLA